MTKQTDKSTARQNIIGAIILAVGIAIAFVMFYHANVNRIDSQNQNYIEDTATKNMKYGINYSHYSEE